MKNNLRITKNGLTYVELLYQQKYYPFIFLKIKRMVIEMLLNSDIQKKIIQMILQFQKEINVIICIIGKKN